ncbi:MAG: beta-lactamase family protein [Armatimonadetes bacterium]|nr:beta-lactamase family protein [Armatimonadota bacterium]
MATSFENLSPLLESAIAERVFPCAAYAIGVPGDLEFGFAGAHTYAAAAPRAASETLFDLASLTKPLYVTAAAMLLHQEGRLDLDAHAIDIWPEFTGAGMEAITVRHLLRHDSGLPAYLRIEDDAPTPGEAAAKLLGLLHKPLPSDPGEETVYSCLNAIYLDAVLHEVVNGDVKMFVRKKLYDTIAIRPHFLPSEEDHARCAPTIAIEPWRRRVREKQGKPYAADAVFVQGEVHDPLAFLQGGVSGNAGLFGTIADVSGFAQEMLRAWHGSGKVFRQETVRRFTAPDAPGKRPLGWDIKASEGSSAGSLFGPHTFGHTGYTGTSIWIDPEAAIFAVLLTNRVHPNDDHAEAMLAVRRAFHDNAYRLLTQ